MQAQDSKLRKRQFNAEAGNGALACNPGQYVLMPALQPRWYWLPSYGGWMAVAEPAWYWMPGSYPSPQGGASPRAAKRAAERAQHDQLVDDRRPHLEFVKYLVEQGLLTESPTLETIDGVPGLQPLPEF